MKNEVIRCRISKELRIDIDCAMVHGESLSHFIRTAIMKEVLLRKSAQELPVSDFSPHGSEGVSSLKADEEIMLMDKLLKLLRVGR